MLPSWAEYGPRKYRSLKPIEKPPLLNFDPIRSLRSVHPPMHWKSKHRPPTSRPPILTVGNSEAGTLVVCPEHWSPQHQPPGPDLRTTDPRRTDLRRTDLRSTDLRSKHRHSKPPSTLRLVAMSGGGISVRSTSPVSSGHNVAGLIAILTHFSPGVSLWHPLAMRVSRVGVVN